MEYDNNLSSYLMTRLKCELSVVERMMKVFPNLQRATIRKVKPNIDYLLVGKKSSLSNTAMLKKTKTSVVNFLSFHSEMYRSRPCYNDSANFMPKT